MLHRLDHRGKALPHGGLHQGVQQGVAREGEGALVRRALVRRALQEAEDAHVHQAGHRKRKRPGKVRGHQNEKGQVWTCTAGNILSKNSIIKSNGIFIFVLQYGYEVLNLSYQSIAMKTLFWP